jgi:predicted acyltransferase
MQQRYYSLDVFRGATVALMILVNNPGSWDHIFAPLDHAEWNGCTPTDLVFPFFLFAVGNAMAFVMPRFEEKGTAYFLKKVFKRTLLIFTIGLLLNWSPFLIWHSDALKGHDVIVPKAFDWMDLHGRLHGIRIMGVLQRIALCYCFASLIVYFGKVRMAFVIGCVILLLYWMLCLFLGSTTDPFGLQGYFGTAIDVHVFSRLHIIKEKGTPFDPEGLASTCAAIVQVIFGYLVGNYILQKGKTFEMLANLFVAGIVLMFIGYWWDMAFPINKRIWTSSYTVYTTGLAIVSLSTLIYLIEFKHAKGAWSRFFDVFGKNPLFIFVLSGFLPRLFTLVRTESYLDDDGTKGYYTPYEWFYEHVCKHVSSDLRVGSLLFALCLIFFYWLIVYILDKKKIYIKV